MCVVNIIQLMLDGRVTVCVTVEGICQGLVVHEYTKVLEVTKVLDGEVNCQQLH